MENKKKQKKKKGVDASKVPNKEGVFEVLWPCGEKTAKIVPIAKRLDTLEGKTIGELWTNGFRGDKVFQILEKELSKRYAGIKFVNYQAFGSTHRQEERQTIAALPDRLRKHNCDAVISSMGC